MAKAYFNGSFLPKEEIHISPDDRGFLFADGIYEVVRWYQGYFYDMQGHMARLKRSLKEVRINWQGADSFPSIARELVTINDLNELPVLVYLEVTRGAAKRAHAFPSPEIEPTVYAFARPFRPDSDSMKDGIGIILRKDIRWTRCDIKSVSLLPNILLYQEARDLDCHECIFSRDGLITEGAHSNIFFVIDGTLYTHPESVNVLSGITRKNVLRLARKEGIPVRETAVKDDMLHTVNEAFITNTSSEVAPVISINGIHVGNGQPGPVTNSLRTLFHEDTSTFKD
jgi:D-alanine transaminase